VLVYGNCAAEGGEEEGDEEGFEDVFLEVYLDALEEGVPGEAGHGGFCEGVDLDLGYFGA